MNGWKSSQIKYLIFIYIYKFFYYTYSNENKELISWIIYWVDLALIIPIGLLFF